MRHRRRRRRLWSLRSLYYNRIKIRILLYLVTAIASYAGIKTETGTSLISKILFILDL